MSLCTHMRRSVRTSMSGRTRQVKIRTNAVYVFIYINTYMSIDVYTYTYIYIYVYIYEGILFAVYFGTIEKSDIPPPPGLSFV